MTLVTEKSASTSARSSGNSRPWLYLRNSGNLESKDEREKREDEGDKGGRGREGRRGGNEGSGMLEFNPKIKLAFIAKSLPGTSGIVVRE